jgi:hypothetical protein
MSIWDWVIIVGVGLQFLLLALLAFAVLKIKNGPMAALRRRITALENRGRTLVTLGQQIYEKNRPHIETILSELAATGDTLHRGAEAYDAVTKEPRALLAQWGQLQRGLNILNQGKTLLRRGAAKTATAAVSRPTSVPRRSLAHRLGLVPPIVQKMERLFPYIGHTVTVYRTLKQNKVL